MMAAFGPQTAVETVSAAGIDDRSFRRLSALLRAACGIVLSDSKKSLAVSRLSRRLRRLGLADFASYCDLLEGADGADEMREMVFLLTTNVTQFFREVHHFETMKADIFPDLIDRARHGGRIRIWSAGCSSGQEPYSIAMALLDVCGDAGQYDIRILATDIDANMVRIGREGVYRQEKGAQPPGLRSAFVEPVAGEDGTLKIAGPVRDLVTFGELNLMAEWPMQGPFDIIFCRNVVIYFDAETQARLWTRFCDILAPGGHLFVGHSERVAGPSAHRLKLVGTTHYSKT